MQINTLHSNAINKKHEEEENKHVPCISLDQSLSELELFHVTTG